MTDSTPTDPSEDVLAALGPRFLAALELRVDGDAEGAAKELQELLKLEPRLPEPRLELAHIHLEAGRLPEAETEAREALKWLAQGGQWVEDLTESQALSLAHGILGEILREKAASDEVVFGDEEAFRGILAESKVHFAKASELDPENEHATHHAFFLGLGGEE
jgi:tetratricopeptide (TPR) repeat protein